MSDRRNIHPQAAPTENTSPLPRYTDEVLAWEYDKRNSALAVGELEWYLKYAARAGDPILELACGSGRLLIPIAQAGYQIDGVDNAQAMLARLRSKTRHLDRAAQGRIRLFCRDMVQFTSQRRYAMVSIALNSLQYLETRDRIQTCFHRVGDLLGSDGFFLFMVQRPQVARYAQGARVVVDWMHEPLVNDQLGVSVGSKFVSYLEPGGQRIVKEREYRIRWHSGVLRTIKCVTRAPVLDVHHYLAMLGRAGFVARAFGGYSDLPADETSSALCFVCRKGAPGTAQVCD